MAPAVKESYTDVLIIGAGPAGLFCANGLAKAGVNVRVIDKRPIQVAVGQADGIQARTLEVLQSYGLRDKLSDRAAQLHVSAYYNPGPNGGIERTARRPNVDVSGARYPYGVALHQGEIESLFLDSMRTVGVEVERPKIPISLKISDDPSQLKDPQAHPVTVVLQPTSESDSTPPADAEEEIVHAKFVLGADGAHSWVRKALNISLEGETSEFVWGVVDIVPDTDFPDIRNKTAIHSENGSCLIIPREGDLVRLYIQLEGTGWIDPATGRLRKDIEITPEKFIAVANKSFYPYRMATKEPISWWTVYAIGQRVATQFSVHNRVFIAGDACHTHSPNAGQGMNASMNDSHNLVWKLTQVLRGWTDMSILSTYESERRRYAQDLIAFDSRWTKLFSARPASTAPDSGVTHAQFYEAVKTFAGFTSGISIHYAPSILVAPVAAPTTPPASPLLETSSLSASVGSSPALMRGEAAAMALVVGQRLPPCVFIRAADARPVEIQDVLPADTRWKVLVFTGRLRAHQLPGVSASAAVDALAAQLQQKLGAFVPALEDAFDVVAVLAGDKEQVDYTDAPPLFRSHWSKVLLDDTDFSGRSGGNGYATYGIDDRKGAIIVVRPDGYVGIVTELQDVGRVDAYFRGFMKTRA